MPFLAVGVEHKTCPLAIREDVVLDPEAIALASDTLRQLEAIDEAAILSTCNRTEIYLFGDDLAVAGAAAAGHLIARSAALEPYLQTWEEMRAVEHLFRVASGLESQSLGEPQILGQVRETLETAQRLHSVGPNLNSLFRGAIACARQARAGTALGRLHGSLGVEAVQAATHEVGSLAGRAILLIGGGEISRLVAEELREHHRIGELYIANRTESVAVELAERYSGRPAPLADVGRLLSQVELVFSATSAPRYVLTPEDFDADVGLFDVPLHVYDLAIPRDVDPAVAALPGVVLHDLDSLLPAGAANRWDADIRTMEAVIAAEVKEFSAWYLTRRVAPVIAHLRQHVEAVSEQELKRVAPQLVGLSARERPAVESLTGRLIDKMFHHLVMRLRLAAQTDPALVEAAEFFFLHGEGGLFEYEGNAEGVRQHDEETHDRRPRGR